MSSLSLPLTIHPLSSTDIDLSIQSWGFHAVLHFSCRGCTYGEFVSIYVDNPIWNDIRVENTRFLAE